MRDWIEITQAHQNGTNFRRTPSLSATYIDEESGQEVSNFFDPPLHTGDVLEYLGKTTDWFHLRRGREVGFVYRTATFAYKTVVRRFFYIPMPEVAMLPAQSSRIGAALRWLSNAPSGLLAAEDRQFLQWHALVVENQDSWIELDEVDVPLPEPEPPDPETGIVPLGVNLDIRHPLGKPDPARLGGLRWVRFTYNVSDGRGSIDLEAAHARYRPYIQRYHDAGYKVLLILTHQTYGEGRDNYWPWPTMTGEKWTELSDHLANMAGQIAAQYGDRVDAYQIWNEPDAQPNAEASVAIQNPASYGYMFRRSAAAIREAAPGAQVITAGFNSGPGPGSTYATRAISMMGDQVPDGIAFHPYGRGVGPVQGPYNLFGDIGEAIRAYNAVLPGKRLWITEFGVQNRRSDSPENVHEFLSGLHDHVQEYYADQVETMILHPWAMSMHNTYGIVDEQGGAIEPLYGWLTDTI